METEQDIHIRAYTTTRDIDKKHVGYWIYQMDKEIPSPEHDRSSLNSIENSHKYSDKLKERSEMKEKMCHFQKS